MGVGQQFKKIKKERGFVPFNALIWWDNHESLNEILEQYMAIEEGWAD